MAGGLEGIRIFLGREAHPLLALLRPDGPSGATSPFGGGGGRWVETSSAERPLTLTLAPEGEGIGLVGGRRFWNCRTIRLAPS